MPAGLEPPAGARKRLGRKIIMMYLYVTVNSLVNKDLFATQKGFKKGPAG